MINLASSIYKDWENLTLILIENSALKEELIKEIERCIDIVKNNI